MGGAIMDFGELTAKGGALFLKRRLSAVQQVFDAAPAAEKTAFQSAVSGGGFPVSIDMGGNHAAQISAALASRRDIVLPFGASFTLTQPVDIPRGVRSVLNLNGSTLTLATGANCYMIRNGDDNTGLTDFELCNGVLNGNGTSQTRNYGTQTSSANGISFGGNYITDYFGFGVAITKAARLSVHDLTINNTNAFGIYYDRCGTVVASGLQFMQAATAGGNGDGISGSARYVYIDGVSGYTNDDMIAVSNGITTLAGYDAGVPAASCIDVYDCEIKNINGDLHTNGTSRPWVAVGIYPTANKTIRNVSIENVTGIFSEHVWRAQNYWTWSGNGYFHTFTVKNISGAVAVDGTGKHSKIQDIARIRTATLSNFVGDTTNCYYPVCRVQNTGIDVLNVAALQYKANGMSASTPVAGLYVEMRSDRGVRNINVSGALLERSATSAMALVEINWVATTFSCALSAEAVTVPITTHPNGSRALPMESLVRHLNSTSPNFMAACDRGIVERVVMSGWAAGADAPCVTLAAGVVALSGSATATAVTVGTVIGTVPYSMRPAAARRVASDGVVLSVATTGDVTIVSTTLTTGAAAVLSGSYAI